MTRGSLTFKNLAQVALLGVVFGLAGATPSQAQDYPNRPVRFSVGFVPGTGADLQARHVADKLSQITNQTFLVENKPGALGSLSASLIAKARPDGYNILSASSSLIAANDSLYKGLSYDSLNDLTPIAAFVTTPFVFVVGADSPIKSIADLAAHLKTKPNAKFGYSTTTGLIAAEYLKSLAKVSAAQVAYKTASDIFPDVMSGALDFAATDIPNTLGIARQGRVRALAVTTTERFKVLPDVPTVDESGFKGYVFAPWFGFYVPAKTPADVIKKLEGWVNKVMAGDDTRKFFEETGNIPMVETGAQTVTRLKKDVQVYRDITKAAGIEPQAVN